MKTFEQVVQESEKYASDRSLSGMKRVDEVAMAWRDGYRAAMGDLAAEMKQNKIAIWGDRSDD